MIDWSTYIEHLQSVLKKFDSIVASINNFLICYFRDNIKPSIRALLDKSNDNLNDLQVGFEQTIDAKAKAARQASLPVWKSDLYCSFGLRHLKNIESKNQKDSETKKSYLSTNSNNGNGNRS